MLWLLVYSSVTVLRNGCTQLLYGRPVPHARDTIDPKSVPLTKLDLPEMALPQLVLALAAATSFHVQIVNRIASGYPIWYLVVATWLVDRQPNLNTNKQSSRGEWAVRAMVMYSMIQGMLFANFLPPA
jgi:phosphatidylinositol glycan class V